MQPDHPPKIIDSKITDGKIIDGKNFAAGLRSKIGERVARLKTKHGITPGLTVVLVGEDPASEVYVRNKGKQTLAAGMHSAEIKLPVTTSEAELLKVVAGLNADPGVDGILVQLPLPSQIDTSRILAAIDPAKDVDGLHSINIGLLWSGKEGFIPCTPYGCMELLAHQFQDLSGKKAVVIGRSNLVGKPIAALLLNANCTVTILHSRSRNIAEECRAADILVAAIGKPEFVKGDWIKEGAVVIDVGINRIDLPDGKTRLVGDVAFAEALPHVAAITPVPGGVGPMTIAMLLQNTFEAACRRHKIDWRGV